MKSKLTLFAALTALLFVLAGTNAFASRTHMNSLGLSGDTVTGQPTADYMIQFDTTHWNINPASVAMGGIPLVAGAWSEDDGTNPGGQGLCLLHLTDGLWMLVSWELSSLAMRGGFWSGLPSYFGNVLNQGILVVNSAIQGGGVGGTTASIIAGDTGNLTAPTLAFMQTSVSLAYKFSNSMMVGAQLGFGYTDSSINDGDSINQQYEPQIKVGAFIPFSKSMNMDVAVHLGIPVVNVDHKDAFTYESSPFAYDLAVVARFNWAVTEFHNMHFFARYDNSDYSTEYKNRRIRESHTFIRKNNNLQVGISDEMKIAKNALAFIGADVLFTKSYLNISGDVLLGTGTTVTYREDGSRVIGTIRTGAEGVILATIQGRLGVNHSFINMTNDLVAESSGQGLSSGTNYVSSVFFGLGAKFGPMVFEFNLDKSIFTEAAGANDLAMDVTFIYLIPEPVAAAESNEE